MRLMYRRMFLVATTFVVTVLAAALMAGSPARADVKYSYAAGSTNYAAKAGDTVNVPLYLVETLTGNSTSLLTAEDGLYGFGIDINRTAGSTAVAAITSNPSFNNNSMGTFDTNGGTASLEANLPFTANDGVQAVAVASPVPNATASEVLLGTLNLTAASGSSTFSVSLFVPSNGMTGGNTLTFDNLYDLDFDSTSPAYSGATASIFGVIVTAPEPISCSLVGLGGLLLLRSNRRRKRSQCKSSMSV